MKNTTAKTSGAVNKYCNLVNKNIDIKYVLLNIYKTDQLLI